MSDAKIDFLYLSESDMMEAGVLDAKGCVEAMRETISLFGKQDFLLGGPKGDEHGLQVNFPAKSDIEDFPLDDGPDRRLMAMPAMAASYLSCKDPKVLSLIGPGVINKCAFMCYMTVLPTIDTVKIKGSSKTSQSTLAMKEFIETQYPQIKQIILCETLEEACRDSDVVSEAMSVTKQNMPEFKLEWFKKGSSVFSMGSFYTKDYDKFTGTTMVVDNYGMYEKYMRNFVARGPVDEFGNKREWCIMGIHFVYLVNEGKAERKEVRNLADMVNGLCKGRTSEDEIVMCSIGGMPLEDLAWAYECYEKAVEKGIGTKLNLWEQPYMK